MAKENNLTITHPDLCKEWHPTLNGDLKPEDFTAGSGKRIYWLLPYDDPRNGKHFDFVWITSIFNRVNGNNCPYLTQNPKVWKGYNDLETLRPDLAKEWHPTKNGNLRPNQVTCNSNKKVWWYLEYYDKNFGKTFEFEWIESINNRNKGNGCPYLSGKKVLKGYNDLETLRPEIAEEWHPTLNGDLKPDQVTEFSYKKIYWKCKKGHTYLSSISNRTNVLRGCPYCAASNSEKLVHNILDRNNIEFEIEKRFINKVKNSPYDIFINNENIFIELDGEQHFESKPFFDKNIPFEKRIEIDNKKNKYAFENNIPLLRIPYTYFKEELKMEALLLDFIRTRIIPKEIIDFYKQYEFSNYAELAEKYNETLKLKVS